MKTKLTIALLSALTGGIFSEYIESFLIERNQFIAIMIVVFADALFGVARALKDREFQTNKAFKFIYMLVAFWLILAVTLSIEKGFPFVSFLSEAVMLPILLFQVISILKNANLLGLINSKTVAKILANIDTHKEKRTTINNISEYE